MKSILIKLGYNGEVYDYATKKTCGIWFAIIGLVIIVSSLLGYDLCVNPIIFVVGYGIGFYLCYGNKKIIFNRLASSQPSCFQKKNVKRCVGVTWIVLRLVRKLLLAHSPKYANYMAFSIYRRGIAFFCFLFCAW